MSTAVITGVIGRIAEALELTVVPDLKSEYPRQQALAAAGLLRVLAPIVELKHTVIEDENAAMAALLGKVASQIEATPGPSKETGLAEAIRRWFADNSGNSTDLYRENLELKQLLSDAIGAFDTLRTMASPEAFADLEADLHSLLRRQLSGGISHWVGFLASTQELSDE